MLNDELRTTTFLISKVQNCLEILNFDAKNVDFNSGNSHGHISIGCCFCFSFLTFLLVSNHFQGYLKFGNLFFLFHQYTIIYFRYWECSEWKIWVTIDFESNSNEKLKFSDNWMIFHRAKLISIWKDKAGSFSDAMMFSSAKTRK